MKKSVYEIMYIIGKLERTVIVLAESRAHAHRLVASTEPDDMTIHIVNTIKHDDGMVFQMNERAARI